MTQGSKSIGEEMAEVMTHPEGRSKDNKPSDDEQIEAGSHEALTHGSKAAVSGAEAYATGNPLKALEAAHEAHKGLPLKAYNIKQKNLMRKLMQA